MEDAISKLAKYFLHLEQGYNIDFDTIDDWELSDAIDFVDELIESHEDDEKLQDMVDELNVTNTHDYVLAVEEFAKME